MTEPFPSLEALKTAHAELLQRRRNLGDSSQDLADAAAVLVERGAALGTTLDRDDDRWTAQSLLNYWANILYRGGYDSIDVTLADYDPEAAPDIPDELCPYLGLDAFNETDSRRFFGRQRLLDVLIQRLRTNRLLIVIGPSGSGKSSLVLGGLIPALRADGLPGSARWRYLPPLMPGADPNGALDRSIANAPFSLQPSLVVVVDQFEETFTLCEHAEEREEFIERLVAIATDPSAESRVILTMRSDFEERVAASPSLQPLFEAAQLRVTPLSAAELREAIERPAAQVGLKFDQEVVDDLVREILGEPAGLPLLQFTLLKLWERRRKNRVPWDVYRASGGGRRALAKSADEFYAGLIPEEQVTARRILLRVVRPGEGLEFTSSRVARSALAQSGEDPGRVDRVLAKLVAARLLRLTPGDTDADDQVGVAHEALVRNWPQLVGWLEEERAAIAVRRRLESKAAEWVRLGSGSAGLLDAVQLQEAERWLMSAEASYLGYNPQLADLVHSSSTAVMAEETARELARERELEQARALAHAQQARAEEQQARAEEQARAGRRLRNYAALLAGMGLIAAIAAFTAVGSARTASESAAALEIRVNERDAALSDTEKARAEAEQSAAAERQARTEAETAREAAQRAQASAEDNALLARSGELAAQALAVSNAPQLSLLLAAEAVSITRQRQLPPPPIATQALSRTLVLASGARQPGPPDAATALTLSPSGGRAAAIAADGTLRVYDFADPAGKPQTLPATQTILGFSADGGRLAVTTADTVISYDLASGAAAPIPGAVPAAAGARLSPDGRRLVTPVSAGLMRVWDLTDPAAAPLDLRGGHSAPAQVLAISADSRWALSGDANGLAVLWDLNERPRPSVRSFARRAGAIQSAAISRDERWLAIGGADGAIHFWPFGASGPTSGSPFVVESAAHEGLTFSPDSTRLAALSPDGALPLWEVSASNRSPGGPFTTLFGGRGTISALTFTADSRGVAFAQEELIYLWYTDGSAVTRYDLAGHDATVTGLGLSADGKLLFSAAVGEAPRRWNLPPQSEAERRVQIATLSQNQQIALACETAGRSMSQAEWARFMGSTPYQPFCAAR